MSATETRSTSTPRVKAFRRRQSWGLHRRSIDVTDAQLDALEVRGYLDPDRRGDRVDECDAIEMFLGDALNERQLDPGPIASRKFSNCSPRPVAHHMPTSINQG
jgi:hypothetical protein